MKLEFAWAWSALALSSLVLACAPRISADGESGGSDESGGDAETTTTTTSDTDTSTDTDTDPCADASTVLEQDVVVESAAQLAALADVVEIRGDLRISDDTMVELVGAHCIERITGTLYISGNDALERVDDALGRLRLITNDEQPSDTGMFITDNPQLVSLTGLRALERIDRRVFVDDNPALVDMRFDALEYVGENFTVGNESLPTLQGLSALVEVGGRLSISDCDALVDLDGLRSLASAGARSSVGGLSIVGNDALTSLEGVALSSVPTLSIRENPSLVDLSGLESLTMVERQLWIYDNATLSSLAGLDNLVEIHGSDELDALSIVRNPALGSLAGLGGLSVIEQHLHLCDNATLADLSGLSSLSTLGRLTAIYNDGLSEGAAMSLADAVPGITWVKIDANGVLPPLWWDKAMCPWNGDLICDEGFEYQGDVGADCDQDCCDLWGPTHLCAADTDVDCQDEPVGPGG